MLRRSLEGICSIPLTSSAGGARTAESAAAAYEARQPCYEKLNFSMAALWLAPADQDKAIDNLLASWGIAEPVKTDFCPVPCG